MSGDSSKHVPARATPPRQWGAIEAVILSFLVYLVPQWFINGIAPWLLPLLPFTNNVKAFVLYGMFEAIAIGFVYAIVRLYGHTLASVGMGRFRLPFVGLALLGYCAYLALTIVLVYTATSIFPIDLMQEQQIGFVDPSGFELALTFLALVIVVPLSEELLFRGFLFKGVRKWFSFPVTALLVSLLFALAHGQLNVGLDTFALSLVLCYLREKTDSIWPGILLHAFKNGVAFLLLFIYNVQ